MCGLGCAAGVTVFRLLYGCAAGGTVCGLGCAAGGTVCGLVVQLALPVVA